MDDARVEDDGLVDLDGLDALEHSIGPRQAPVGDKARFGDHASLVQHLDEVVGIARN